MGVLDNLFYTERTPTPMTDAVMTPPAAADLQAFGVPAGQDYAALKAYASSGPQPTPGVRFAPDPHDAMTHTAAASAGYVNPEYAEESGGSPLFWKNVASNPDVPVAGRMLAGYGVGLPTELFGGAIGSLYRSAALPGDVATGKVDPASDEGMSRTFEMAGTLGLGGSVMPKPAGSVGIFGGGAKLTPEHFSLATSTEPQAAAATGAAQRIASQNRFVRQLQTDSDQAAKDHVMSLIPPPLSNSQRAIRNTAGMSVDEILQSEPLWGYAQANAESQGIPHHEAFARLANQIFDAHGHASYMTPSDAKLFMQMERFKHGMDPSVD